MLGDSADGSIQARLYNQEFTMPVAQGSTALLDDPTAKELLRSRIPARLAYIWPDGSPRVVPVWFHWNGSEFVIATPPKAPKLKALRRTRRLR